MGRHKIFASHAERQQAYRLRQLAASEKPPDPIPTAPPPKKQRPPSRPARLRVVVAEVENLLQEYQEWYDAIPESLKESEQAVRLAETIEQLESIATQLADVNPPRGFGKD